MARFFAALIAISLSVVPFAAPAEAADGVDLDTSLFNFIDFPVPDSPIVLNVAVNNFGTTSATNVVVQVPVPTGATVVSLSANCSTAAAVITCAFPSIGPGTGEGASLYLMFAATGTYAISSSAHADQPDVDGDSSDQLNVNVVPENADLAGRSEATRVVAGTQATFPVANQFTNLGPTAAGDATVSGTVTGGATIVPGSFNFFRDFFIPAGNVADDQCTVTATTFTCAPVSSGGVFYAPQPFVFYDVMLPATTSTVVASATLTGRADPDHTNDTSTVTIDVDEPAAEILTQITPIGVIPSQQPTVLDGIVSNVGELDANELVAVFEVPAGWDLTVPPGPLPSGVACELFASPHALRCTRTTLAAGDWWSIGALVTPPAGTGTGDVSLAVSTATPEAGIHPNNATMTIEFAPMRALDIEPGSDLEDGDVVTLSGTGFSPSATIFYCEAIVTGTIPDASDCGVPIQSTLSDPSGAFSVNVTVERFFVIADIGVVDCAQPGETCGIAASDFLSPGGSVVVEPMTFTSQPPVDDPFGARITGTVISSAGGPVGGVRMSAYRSSDRWVAPLHTTTDASGNYVLEDAEPGIAYRILFRAPSGSDLVTEWYGGAGSEGTTLRSIAASVDSARSNRSSMPMPSSRPAAR